MMIELHLDDTGFYDKPYVWLRRIDGQTEGVVYLDEIRLLPAALATAAVEMLEMVAARAGERMFRVGAARQAKPTL